MEQVEKYRRPLPPGLVTIGGWAREVKRQPGSIHANWKPLPGFPARVGVIPGPGRNNGGLPEDVYSRAELNAWRAGQPKLWGRRSTWLIVGHGEDEPLSLDVFAELAGLEVPDPAAGAFPLPALGGLFRLGDLVGWQNAQPPSAGHLLAATFLGRDELVTIAKFARLVRRQDKTVSQYRDKDPQGFPAAAQGRSYRLGELADWWNGRPGKVSPRERERAVPAAFLRRLTAAARQVLELAGNVGLEPRLSPAGARSPERGRVAVAVGSGARRGLAGTIIVSPGGRIVQASLRGGTGAEEVYSGAAAVRNAITVWARTEAPGDQEGS